jgi:hypothetical protein
MEEEPKGTFENVQDVGQYAVGKLAVYLDVGVTLAHYCEMLAAKPDGDRLAPIHAAARLIRAHIEEGRRLIAWAKLVSAKLAFRESPDGIAAPEIRTIAERADLLRLFARCGGGGADRSAGGKLQA